MRRIRARLTYANVLATLALLFAMSGGAIAASHYVISSPRQIKPSVLKKLRGRTGRRGAAGPKGLTGNTGAQGPQGAPGLVGPSGPQRLGAINVDLTVPSGTPMLVTLDNVSIEGQCNADVDLAMAPAPGGELQMAGTETLDGSIVPAPIGGSTTIAGTKSVGLDASGRGSAESSFARFDLHGEKVGTACHYWGVAFPLT